MKGTDAKIMLRLRFGIVPLLHCPLDSRVRGNDGVYDTFRMNATPFSFANAVVSEDVFCLSSGQNRFPDDFRNRLLPDAPIRELSNSLVENVFYGYYDDVIQENISS